MVITAKQWADYRNKLASINKRASELMQEYVNAHGFEVNDALIDYAYSLATKYGEAAGSLACQMYDEVADYWEATRNKRIPSAVPASTASRNDVEKAIAGASLQSPEYIAPVVGRLVKMAGQDTTLKNALRDGAEWAWVPSGETCAFCITLASNGWQRASKQALKNGHAQHIHANCDCAYMIRFDSSMEVEGYNPDEYYERYNNASDSYDWKDKLNAMRRENYASKKDLINAQKREAYARRQQLKAEEE